MLKGKLPIALLCIALSTSSCRFSEECYYTGSVDIMMDWDALWGNIIKPDTLTVLFYKANQPPVKKELTGDTIFSNIPAGQTELIIFNQPGDIKCKSIESLNNAELQLSTYFEGNTRATKECPLICTFSNSLMVPIDKVVQQQVSPMPIVKELDFTVNVTRNGVMGNLESCNATLSGIATRYSLQAKEPIRSKATVYFSLEKGVEDVFKHRFYVLGVNPDNETDDKIEKKLSVTVILDDGETKSVDVDLSEQLNQFTSNVFKCTIDITISSLSADVNISNWEQGIWDEITIQ